MNLEQKTFGRRNFLKGVIAGLLGLTAIIVGGVTTLATLGHRTYEGNIDGVKTNYLQTWRSCRKLTLKEQNGMKTVMYDRDDNNLLGDHPFDFVEMTFPNGIKVRYTHYSIRVQDGKEKRVLKRRMLETTLEVVTASGEKETIQLKPTDEVFSDYTKIFNLYRDRIMNKR